MADLTPHDNKFSEELGGFFYDMMKAAGMTMFQGSFPERVRDIGSKMARVIERAAERKSIQVIKQLQTAVVTGFQGMEKELDELKELVGKQQEQIDFLKGQMTKQRAINRIDGKLLKTALEKEPTA